ncbi:hypothetical protein MY11210_000915 [Beauveria gryllotalpidicola]
MNQNNDSNNNNGGEGNEQSSRQIQNRGVDPAIALRGLYTFVRDEQAVGVSRTDDAARNALQDVRSVPEDREYTIKLAGNRRKCRPVFTTRRPPLDISFNYENGEETPPASNGQENRLSAPVQTAEQETQENRLSASVERSGRNGRENRLSASVQTAEQENRLSASVQRSGRSDQENRESAPDQQGALTGGGQPWSEQIPSQNQLKLRQRREQRDQRQLRRRRGAPQQRYARSRRPPFLVSSNDRNKYLEEETKRLEALHEANKRVDEAESAYRAQLQQFNRLARSNHRG